VNSSEENSAISEESEWEFAYFKFMAELADKNSSRYEIQAGELVKAHKMEILLKKLVVRYSLGARGCSFYVSNDGGQTFEEMSWVHTGWRKSSKLECLPQFFAQTETSVLFDQR